MAPGLRMNVGRQGQGQKQGSHLGGYCNNSEKRQKAAVVIIQT